MAAATERELDTAFHQLVITAMEIAHRVALEGVRRIPAGGIVETADDYLNAYQKIFEDIYIHIEAVDESQVVKDEALSMLIGMPLSSRACP